MNIGNHWAAYFSNPQTIICYLLAYYRLSQKNEQCNKMVQRLDIDTTNP